HGAAAAHAALLAAPAGHAVGDVQRVVAIVDRRCGALLALVRGSRMLGSGRRRRRRGCRGGGPRRSRGAAALFLGARLRFRVGGGALLLLFGAAALFLRALLGGAPLALLGLAALDLGALGGRARLFLGAALRVELFLLLARLLLEHVALDVRALLANLDVDRARAA